MEIPSAVKETPTEGKIIPNAKFSRILLGITFIATVFFGFYFFIPSESQKTGICQHKNTKFNFQFKYNCAKLSIPENLFDGSCTRDQTCLWLEENGNRTSGGIHNLVKSTDLPLCSFKDEPGDFQNTVKSIKSCFKTGTSNQVIEQENIEHRLTSFRTPYTAEEQKLVDQFKNIVQTEKVLEPVSISDSRISFYKLPRIFGNEDSLCSVNSKTKPASLICFQNSQELAPELSFILKSFEFY